MLGQLFRHWGGAGGNFSLKFELTSARSNLQIRETAEYLQAREKLAENQIVFVTGCAGSGKSSFVDWITTQLKDAGANFVKLAPTGLAALNIDGQTIHSFFGLRADDPPSPENVKARKNPGIFQSLDVLILDEISMVRADMLDFIDAFMRKNGRDPVQPFGGVKLLMVGDLSQLPPVVKSDDLAFKQGGYSSPFFFDAKIFHKLGKQGPAPIASLELTTVFRQETDLRFAALLQNIREQRDVGLTLRTLNRLCVRPLREDEAPVQLVTLRRYADKENLARLAQLAGPSKIYTGFLSGNFERSKRRALPAPLELELRQGAQVIFTRNDPVGRWVNGTSGRIAALRDNSVSVEITGNSDNPGQTVEVHPVEWTKKVATLDKGNRISSSTVASYRQLPLLLSWAITLHKSQGLTLANVRLDTSHGTFAPGQLYVGLTRARRAEDMSFTAGLYPKLLHFDYPEAKRALSFTARLRELSVQG